MCLYHNTVYSTLTIARICIMIRILTNAFVSIHEVITSLSPFFVAWTWVTLIDILEKIEFIINFQKMLNICLKVKKRTFVLSSSNN